MKKIIALFLSMFVVISMLAACGENSGGSSTSATKAPEADTKSSPASSGDHKAVTIKLQGAFAEGADHYFYLDEFIQKLSDLSEGSVTVVWGAGPEAIPTDQLGEAMQNGIVELVYSPCTFLTSVAPALGGVKLIDVFEARTNGGFEYINEITSDVLGCQFLGRCAANSPYIITSNVEITSLDSFKGVVFRGTAAHRPLLEALGAEVVTMGWADVYSAIDKNVVSGVGGTYRDFVDNDLGGKVKYIIDPGFYCSDSSLFIANSVWEKLDDVQKNALLEAAKAWEDASADYNIENNKKDIDTLTAAGSKVISLKDLGCDEEFLQTAYDAAWAAVESSAPDAAAKMREYSNY